MVEGGTRGDFPGRERVGQVGQLGVAPRGRCSSGAWDEQKRGNPGAAQGAEQRRTARVKDQQRCQSRAAAAALPGRVMFKLDVAGPVTSGYRSDQPTVHPASTI